MSDLKTVVSINGEYSKRNFTVFDIQSLKGQRQLTKTLPFSPEEAAAAEEAGIETLNVRYNPERPELASDIRKAAPNTFMTFAMPMNVAKSSYEVLNACFNAMELGADSIMCGGWSIDFVEVAAKSGLPVEGHVGLVPRKSTWTGGLKTVGKTFVQAEQLFLDLRHLEAAGAWAVEIEVVPQNILSVLVKNSNLVVTSIGSGKADIQFLFAEDILGDSKNRYPRHSKQYANLQIMRDRLQLERVTAFKGYINEVKSDKFPSKEHLVQADPEVERRLIELIEKKTYSERKGTKS